MDLGNFEEVDDYKLEGQILEAKNMKLIPLYNSIKELIRKLKKTEANELYDEYLLTRAHLRKKIVV